MVLALVVLLVTSLLAAAVFATTQGDVSLTRADLNGKRAYSAAQAAVQSYLYNLNINSTNSQWWETCSHDMSNGNGAQVAVPGTTTGTTYSYTPVPDSSERDLQHGRSGRLAHRRLDRDRCASDSPATRAMPRRRSSPASRPSARCRYLWYTVHETVRHGHRGQYVLEVLLPESGSRRAAATSIGSRATR